MSAERLDQWLWAVRIFKTRSLAAEACRRGRVIVGGMPAKPAKAVRAADVIEVREAELGRTFKVIALPASRVGAKLVPEYCQELTTPEVRERLRQQRVRDPLDRPKGSGRPTKQERRRIDWVFGDS